MPSVRHRDTPIARLRHTPLLAFRPPPFLPRTLPCPDRCLSSLPIPRSATIATSWLARLSSSTGKRSNPSPHRTRWHEAGCGRHLFCLARRGWPGRQHPSRHRLPLSYAGRSTPGFSDMTVPGELRLHDSPKTTSNAVWATHFCLDGRRCAARSMRRKGSPTKENPIRSMAVVENTVRLPRDPAMLARPCR